MSYDENVYSEYISELGIILCSNLSMYIIDVE